MSLVSSDLNQVVPDKSAFVVAKADRPKATCSIAELRNGKVIFRQKPLSFDNLSETMQEIMSFRGWVEATNGPLATIPDDHLPLIAKLVHESDKSLPTLIKTIQLLLLPPTLESSQESEGAEALGRLTAPIVEVAIKAVAERVNYGINMDKTPAALCAWRWEVENRNWLPKSVREKACQRFQERVAAKKHLQIQFDALSNEERDVILRNAKSSKSFKHKEIAVDHSGMTTHVPETLHIEKQEIPEPNDSNTKKAGRPRKAVDSEVTAKEQERLERKVIKAEKEKKNAEATKKSAVAFVNFFKPGTSSKRNDLFNVNQAQPLAPGSSTPVCPNDFERTFKPFVVKKDAHLAPANWFITKTQYHEQHHTRKDKRTDRRDIVEIDDEGREVGGTIDDQDVSMDVETEGTDVLHLNPREVLRSFVESQPPSLHPICRGLLARRRFKAQPQHRVSDIMQRLNDAEVQGDQRAVRKLTSLLKNRRKIPTKILVFAENNRPGYLGTWTKNSPVIGPRTPFARDQLSLDYDHDSDAEWQDGDSEGGEGEDVDSPDEGMEDDSSDTGSDMDGWLIEGDEMEVESVHSPDALNRPVSGLSRGKRKATRPHEPQTKKRKVVPLIPFHKGPIWEKEIGDYDYAPFKPMRIQLFNDTPFPLDPFTFVSNPVILEKPNSSAFKDADGVFVVPAIPERLLPLPLASTDPSSGDTCMKRRAVNPAPPPKTTFPDIHIPLLLQKVDASNTSSFAVLLDLIFQDLKPLGIKKNALEVKLREVSEKDKAKKAWVVKADAQIRYGVSKPA